MTKWLIILTAGAIASITSAAYAGDKELAAYRQQKREYA
jgi:hypothetical protein